MPKTVYAYIFRELIEAFVLAFVAYGFVMMLGVVFQPIQHGLGVMLVVKILPYYLPTTLPWVVSISMLTACVIAYGRLSSENEMLALNALGMNPIHIISPAIVLAVMAAVPLLYCNHFIEARTHELSKAAFKEALLTRPFSLLSMDNPVFDDVSDVKIYIGDADQNRLSDIFIFRYGDFKKEKADGSTKPAPGDVQVTYAREATYEIVGKGASRVLHLNLRDCELKYINRAEPFGYNIVHFAGTSEKISLADEAYAPGWKDMTTPELLIELRVQDYLRQLTLIGKSMSEAERAAYGRDNFDYFVKQIGRTSRFAPGDFDAAVAAAKANEGEAFNRWTIMQDYIDDAVVDRRALNDILTRVRLRWSSGFDVLALALLGVPLGILTKRGRKLVGFGVSVLVVVVLYFPLVVTGKALSINGVFLAPVWPYASAIIIGAIGLFLLRRQFKV